MLTLREGSYIKKEPPHRSGEVGTESFLPPGVAGRCTSVGWIIIPSCMVWATRCLVIEACRWCYPSWNFKPITSVGGVEVREPCHGAVRINGIVVHGVVVVVPSAQVVVKELLKLERFGCKDTEELCLLPHSSLCFGQLKLSDCGRLLKQRNQFVTIAFVVSDWRCQGSMIWLAWGFSLGLCLSANNTRTRLCSIEK